MSRIFLKLLNTPSSLFYALISGTFKNRQFKPFFRNNCWCHLDRRERSYVPGTLILHIYSNKLESQGDVHWNDQ
mgnify:CR=1 FL=1